MTNIETNLDLPIIIKRLDLIKSFIFLGEEVSIADQVNKLQQLQINEELQKIIIHLNQKSFTKAISEIEAFIEAHNQLLKYIDPEIDALHFEAKTLEAQLKQLSDEKAELEKLLHEFDVRHNHELGELIIKILKLRKKKATGSPQQAEAEKDYDDFNANYEITKDEKIAILTEEELIELKNKYRKASKLCHPDVVDIDQKETAHKIFTELSNAYEKNDLKRVTEILENLQEGKTYTSKADIATEKTTLKIELERLRLRLNELNIEINNIKLSDAYEKIISIVDWNEYFIQIKQQLQQQLIQLENEGK